MDTALDLKEVAARLEREADPFVDRWMAGLLRRSWSLHTPAKGEVEAGGRTVLQLLHERCQHILAALVGALETAPALQAGAPDFRETVQHLSFTAGWMAGQGLSATDAVGLVHSLQEALALPCETSGGFFEALLMVAAESYAAALQQKAQARYRDAMEKSQLVCEPHPRLPCLFLVGEPDVQALDDAVGRLMMLAVMHEARAVVVDGTGLFRPEPLLRALLERHLSEERVPAVHVAVAGVPPTLLESVPRTSEEQHLSLHETLAAALQTAAGISQLVWPT